VPKRSVEAKSNRMSEKLFCAKCWTELSRNKRHYMGEFERRPEDEGAKVREYALCLPCFQQITAEWAEA
jgi:hypothetical protein